MEHDMKLTGATDKAAQLSMSSFQLHRLYLFKQQQQPPPGIGEPSLRKVGKAPSTVSADAFGLHRSVDWLRFIQSALCFQPAFPFLLFCYSLFVFVFVFVWGGGRQASLKVDGS